MNTRFLLGLVLLVCTPVVTRPLMAAPSSPPALVAGEPAQSRNGPNDGRTPVTRARLEARDAIWYNNPQDLIALLDAGLDVNAPDDNARETMLHTAAWRDRLEIARILLARGADRSLRDKDGKRPADYASSPEMRALLGPAAPQRPASQTPARGEEHCRRMWREATALCGLGATSCNTSAHIRYQQCQRTGTWY